jgi:hypothetical protein
VYWIGSGQRSLRALVNIYRLINSTVEALHSADDSKGRYRCLAAWPEKVGSGVLINNAVKCCDIASVADE